MTPTAAPPRRRRRSSSILTSTATDIGAAADQQGAGLLNIYAAVEAARQMPGTTKARPAAPRRLVDQPHASSTCRAPAARRSTTRSPCTTPRPPRDGHRHATGRWEAPAPFGWPVTENVSAPPPTRADSRPGGDRRGADQVHGAAGVDQLDADMIWPDPTNSDDNILTILLTDPSGKLAQQSYDYGGSNWPQRQPGHPAHDGSASDGRHLDRADPVVQRPRPRADPPDVPRDLHRNRDLPGQWPELHDQSRRRRPSPSRRAAR